MNCTALFALAAAGLYCMKRLGPVAAFTRRTSQLLCATRDNILARQRTVVAPRLVYGCGGISGAERSQQRRALRWAVVDGNNISVWHEEGIEANSGPQSGLAGDPEAVFRGKAVVRARVVVAAVLYPL